LATRIKVSIDGRVMPAVWCGPDVAGLFEAHPVHIAQDLTKMQVYVSTDESDVARSRRGRPEFQVDAFPTETFGKSFRGALNATTVQNVVDLYHRGGFR